MTQTPLIPREVLLGNPQRHNPQISPNGRFITYIAPDDKDVLQIWLDDLTDENSKPRLITAEPKRGIYYYCWAHDNRHVLYQQDSDGDENFHVFAVDINSDKIQARDLTPFEGIRAEVDTIPEFPDDCVIVMNLRNKEDFDVYRVNISTGQMEMKFENPGKVMFLSVDCDFEVRAALRTRTDGGSDLLVRETPENPFEKAQEFSPDDACNLLFFSRDGKKLYYYTNADANALRMMEMDIASKSCMVVAEDAQFDFQHCMHHPVKRTINAAAFYKERLDWFFLDEDYKNDFDLLAELRDGDINIVAQDIEDKKWLVSITTDDGPIFYYYFDRIIRQSKYLFSNRPALEDAPLGKMNPVQFTARDGMTIYGYLTLPVGGAKNLPTVLNVHGGPWHRDRWGYRSDVQWLANRGYAVLQINYRGSTGYGKMYLNAGNRQWSLKMHDDLIDGVNWLVEQGISDRKRIGIFGGSYGGYATLVGLTKTPEVFAAGVDIVGPSSLFTLIKSFPPYFKALVDMINHRIGDPEKDRQLLEDASPLNYADSICRPLLIAQGANDPRVKQAESDQIVSAMREKDIPVEYVVYTDEGHGFARQENNLHFFALAENFLAKHIGGREEPVSEVLGHSGEIR